MVVVKDKNTVLRKGGATYHRSDSTKRSRYKILFIQHLQYTKLLIYTMNMGKLLEHKKK